jgi:hypothetical protein
MTACADTFLSVCRLNDGIQFYCDRVSVPFLKDKREALVDSFLCYLECDIREFRRATRGVGRFFPLLTWMWYPRVPQSYERHW